VKRLLWLLLIAACLPFPALSQTTDGHQDSEINEAYTRFLLSEAYMRFFGTAWNLMERDMIQRNVIQPIPGEVMPHLKGNAHDWLAARSFKPSDIARIENALPDWYVDQRELSIALAKSVYEDNFDLAVELEGRLARIALDAGTKLESQLEDRKHFHNVIRDCTHQLRLVPGYEGSRCFAPPKPRFT
jgi:hypothetical protein